MICFWYIFQFLNFFSLIRTLKMAEKTVGRGRLRWYTAFLCSICPIEQEKPYPRDVATCWSRTTTTKTMLRHFSLHCLFHIYCLNRRRSNSFLVWHFFIAEQQQRALSRRSGPVVAVRVLLEGRTCDRRVAVNVVPGVVVVTWWGAYSICFGLYCSCRFGCRFLCCTFRFFFAPQSAFVVRLGRRQ